jgi:deoxyribonuclease-4
MGAEVVQVFSSNPRAWRMGPPDAAALGLLGAALCERGLPLFFHTVYLINLASPDDGLRQRSVDAVAHALVTGALAGAAGVVTHLGSHKGQGFATAAPRVVEAVRSALALAERVLAQAERALTGVEPHFGFAHGLPPLLLETAAGAGGTIGSTLEEMAALLTASPAGVSLCLDTAHLFAAGYPVHEADGLEAVIDESRRAGLLELVRLVHLNDSGTPFASKRDRHVNPGEGSIGYAGLARVVKHPALAAVPFVLEVPGPDKHGPSATEVAAVKTMRLGAPVLPARPAPGA